MASIGNKYKVILYILVALLIATGFFFIGRASIKVRTVTKIKYIPGDTVKITRDSLVPVEINSPLDTIGLLQYCLINGLYTELFPEKIKDSLIFITKDDTAAIIKDWMTERVYNEELFDNDTLGSCSLLIKVKSNRLNYLSYTYSPVVKTISDIQIPESSYHLYAGAGLSTNYSLNVGGTLLIKDSWGISLNYLYEVPTKKSGFNLTVQRRIF